MENAATKVDDIMPKWVTDSIAEAVCALKAKQLEKQLEMEKKKSAVPLKNKLTT